MRVKLYKKVTDSFYIALHPNAGGVWVIAPLIVRAVNNSTAKTSPE